MEERTQNRKFLLAACIAAFAAIAGLYFIAVRYGELNQDEGWYLYGAGLIRAGQQPYVDFATTQGPVMQYFYAAFWPVVQKYGVAGGRAVTAGLGLLSMLVCCITVLRLAEREKRLAACLALLCLAGLNMYQVYFFSIVKTYSLASLLITTGFLLLTFRGRAAGPSAFASGAVLALAAGTRMSAGLILPAVLAALIISARRAGGLKDRRWLLFGAGAAVTLLLVLGPFIIKAPAAVRFAMLEYHAGRETGSAITAIAYKCGFAARLARAYFPALAVFLAVMLTGWQKSCSSGAKRFIWTCFACCGLVTLLHAAAPFPYDDYQAMIYPLFCTGVVLAAQFLIPAGQQIRAACLILAAGLIFAAGSPVNEEMFIGRRDRIWWPVRTETSLHKLKRAAAAVREKAGADGGIFTQDLYLAVEAGLKVPKGMELGPFCLFPGWSRGKASECHVLNEEMMLEVIAETQAGVAAVSEYSFAVSAPAIKPYAMRDELIMALGHRYEPVWQIDNFGQAETCLTVYARKEK